MHFSGGIMAYPPEGLEYIRQRNNRIAEELINTQRESRTDMLEPGYYEVRANELVRVGDAQSLLRFHGTNAEDNGGIIREFRAEKGNWDSVYRPSIGGYPGSIYTTTDVNAAIGYGDQLYTILITPRAHVNLEGCHDDNLAHDAIRRGADVIECPDFWEQPETIVLNPDVMEVQSVQTWFPMEHGHSSDNYEGTQLPLGVEPLEGYTFTYVKSDDDHISPSINDVSSSLITGSDNLLSSKVTPSSLADAISDYKDAESHDRGSVDHSMDKSMEYRGMQQMNPSTDAVWDAAGCTNTTSQGDMITW